MYLTAPHKGIFDRQPNQQKLVRKCLLKVLRTTDQGANTKMQQRRNLPSGDMLRATFHVRNVCHGCKMQRELVQEVEKNSGCRTFSKQGLSGLKGDPLRNVVRHLKNTSHRSLTSTTTVSRVRRRAQLRSSSRHVKCGDAAYVASNTGKNCGKQVAN